MLFSSNMSISTIIYNQKVLLNEIKKYVAFFDEIPNYNQIKITGRDWYYNDVGSGFLKGKPVLHIAYYYMEAILYDYSDLLNKDIDSLKNVKYILDEVNIVSYDLTKTFLSKDKIETILANNAKAAIMADKMERQIEKLRSIDEDF